MEVTVFNRGQRVAPVPLPDSVTRILGDRTEHAEFVTRLRDEPRFDVVVDMIGRGANDAHSLLRAVRGRVRQVLFCSSVEVYAPTAATLPITEDATTGPPTEYGRDKLVCETILLRAERQADLSVSVIRLGHVYGEGGGIAFGFSHESQYLEHLRQGKAIIVPDEGPGFCAPCHVDDVARAFVAAVGKERAFGRTYHLSGDERVTWDAYNRLVAEAAGAPAPRLVHIRPTTVTPSAPVPILSKSFKYAALDVSRARDELGFQCTVALRDGLTRSVRWLDANRVTADHANGPYEQMLASWDQAGVRRPAP